MYQFIAVDLEISGADCIKNLYVRAWFERNISCIFEVLISVTYLSNY